MYALSHNQVLHNNDFKDYAEVETKNTYKVMIKLNIFKHCGWYLLYSFDKINESLDQTYSLINNKSDLLLNSINQLVKETKKVIQFYKII